MIGDMSMGLMIPQQTGSTASSGGVNAEALYSKGGGYFSGSEFLRFDGAVPDYWLSDFVLTAHIVKTIASQSNDHAMVMRSKSLASGDRITLTVKTSGVLCARIRRNSTLSREVSTVVVPAVGDACHISMLWNSTSLLLTLIVTITHLGVKTQYEYSSSSSASLADDTDPNGIFTIGNTVGNDHPYRGRNVAGSLIRGTFALATVRDWGMRAFIPFGELTYAPGLYGQLDNSNVREPLNRSMVFNKITSTAMMGFWWFDSALPIGAQIIDARYQRVASLPATVVNGARYVLIGTPDVEYLGVAGAWVAQPSVTMAIMLWDGSTWNLLWDALDVCPIPLLAQGTGAGVLQIRLTSSVDTVAYLDGAGKFYTDAAGTLGESTATLLTANVDKVMYIKCASGSCNLTVENSSKLIRFGTTTSSMITEATNAPIVNGFDTRYISSTVQVIRIVGTASKVTGTTYAWINATFIFLSGALVTISGTTYAWLNTTFIWFNGSLMTISGTTYAWLNATSIRFDGALMTISGTTYAWLNATSIWFNGSLMTISGTTYAWLNGSTIWFTGALMTISGTTYAWLSAIYVGFNGALMTITYVTKTWRSTLIRVQFSTPSITTAMADQIFIDINASGSTPIGDKVLSIAGLCGPVTSASLTARNAEIALGFTVTANT